VRISRAELKKLSPAELVRLEAVLEQVVQDREAGKVPWLCDVPGCDGMPHEGRQGRHARASQRPPGWQWDIWLLLAGRGFGKTRTGAEWAIEKARTQDRGALIGPTAADTRDILVEGESGILACAPATFRPEYQPSKRRLVYPNGSIQMCYSADEPDRLRGPQHHYGWFDELAAWRYLQKSWDMAQLGMRLGEHPQICVTTTPRPLPLIKQLLKDEQTAVTRGSTYDNLQNLAPTFRRAVVAKYEGTTLGRQELDAEVLEDLPGALVARRHIDAARVSPDQVPELVDIVIGMDPAGTGTGDETGLVVVGRAEGGHFYVMSDVSEKLTPAKAVDKAYTLLETSGASRIVVEDNGPKDWLEEVLRRGWKDRRQEGAPPIRRVNASKGKKLRAQPVAMRYEQGRVHHVGSLPELEDQLTTWIPEEDPDSPDRVDAMVHGVAHLARKDRAEAIATSPYGARRAGSAGHEHPLVAARRRAQQRAAS
jgi:phage terminase large subunit-like protein